MIKLFSVKVKRVKERERAGESQRAFPFFFFLGFLSSFLKAWKPHSFTYTLISSFFPPFFSRPALLGTSRRSKRGKEEKTPKMRNKGWKKRPPVSCAYKRVRLRKFPCLSSPFLLFICFFLYFVFVRIFVCYTLLSRPSFLTTCSLSLSLSLSLLGVDKQISQSWTYRSR